MLSRVAIVLICIIAVSVTGCAYRAKGSLAQHIKTIAVPVFNNRTHIDDYTRKIEVEVTDATRAAFLQGGELKIAGREDADLVLEGEIISFHRDTIRSDRLGDPVETRLIVRARISVYDVREARFLYKDLVVTNGERKTESGVYSLRRGETEQVARQKAVEDLGRQISRHVVEHW